MLMEILYMVYVFSSLHHIKKTEKIYSKAITDWQSVMIILEKVIMI